MGTTKRHNHRPLRPKNPGKTKRKAGKSLKAKAPRVLPKRLSPEFQFRPEIDLDRMLRAAMKHCRLAGFNVDDPDYGDVITRAVLRSAKSWLPSKGASPITLACRNAKYDCGQFAKHPQPCVLAGSMDCYADEFAKESKDEQVSLLDDTDCELLKFVLVHGKTKAASLLRMGLPQLRQELDRIEVQASVLRQSLVD